MFNKIKSICVAAFFVYAYFNPAFLAVAGFAALLMLAFTRNTQYVQFKVFAVITGIAYLYFHDLLMMAGMVALASLAIYIALEVATARIVSVDAAAARSAAPVVASRASARSRSGRFA